MIKELRAMMKEVRERPANIRSDGSILMAGAVSTLGATSAVHVKPAF
jgi:hypothetical protein